MPAPTREEIAKMKEELRKDLEALERVERLFAERNGSHSSAAPQPLWKIPPVELESEQAVLGLKQLCILGLKTAGQLGAAPRDLLAFCKRHGYTFTSDVNGSASITTALSRLIGDKKARREDGRYYWVGGEQD